MELHDKRVLVVGLGKTGISAADFLLSRGARVSVSDSARHIDVPQDLIGRGLRVEAGEHRIDTFTSQDLIVVSPGVPMMLRPLIEAQARGIEVVSEIELAYRHISAPIIAVTGTNGKTTTTSLLGHLFERSGRGVFVGGNIGTPLLECLRQQPEPDAVIVEVSSFQLETIRRFRPHISLLLNITDDHLDRYASFEEYRQAKARIFMNQQNDDFLIANRDDPAVRGTAALAQATPFFFSRHAALETGAFDDGRLNFRCPGRPALTIETARARLRGTHNRENMLAAVSAAFLSGLPAASIQEAVDTFTGLPHRMELVGEIGGVSYINDSKGTNVGACRSSLESIEGSLVLIAGGKDKGGSYEPLAALLHKKARALVLLGEAAERMQAELSAHVATVRVNSLEEAVAEASRQARPGDTVLLSPACASFDMFESYAHRGECFKTLVTNINHTATADVS